MLDADTELRNWAKWLADESGIYPRCAGNWDLIVEVPYKNGDNTTQEKLERVERQIPADERAAERIELWVSQFDLLPRIALRVQYVHRPEYRRYENDMIREQWQIERTNYLRVKLRQLGNGQAVDVDTYEQAVAEGIRQVQHWINRWVAGV